MDFASRLTRHPIPFDRERGTEALALFPDLAPELRPLIEGAGGCSPFLLRLMGQETDWLAAALSSTPEAAQDSVLADLAALAPTDLDSGLRRAKRRAALFVALADLGGVWDLYQVTTAWTDFADACVRRALIVHVGAEARRGKLPGMSEEAAQADGAGMVVLAMGKMGAAELNYSSDIDLICLFDEARFDPDESMDARAGFVRATRKLAASLSENTAEGYVFRTDLRLRPDASVTPVCISMAAAERYYEAEGRSWERAAYIKARAAAGDIAAGERFLTTLEPFVWRKHLDFAAIQDTHDMRRRIRAHKGLHGPIQLDGHNMKLGAGGIREIEFFAQTRQLVSGGRDPDLRQRRTRDALAALADKGWVEGEAAEKLTGLYAGHREIEHRLQMINDAQTHLLPTSDEGFDRLACFCGEADTKAFRTRLAEDLRATDALTEPFFAPGAPGDAPQAVMPEMSQTARELVARWPGYPALRSARGQEIFARLRPDLLTRFHKSARPDEALSNFDGFLKGLPAGVQLFSLFEANPPLIDLLVDICATSPALARHLSQNAGVLDAVLGGSFFAPWPSHEELLDNLETVLSERDYETQLDAARRWMKEWHFRVGVHHLRGLIDAAEAGAQYSMLADVVLRGLWPLVCDQIAQRHGPAPGRGGAVVAMGSLGAGRLTAGSDLDLIVIYDAGGVEITDGRRPLDPRGWFAKATKALVTALSAPTAEGKLFEVDMRLRPSGRQGPVATGLAAFRSYQLDDAWSWEHMALTRARPVAGDAGLLADIEAIRAEVLSVKAAAPSILRDLGEMRARLQAAGRTAEPFDVKNGPGGMQDIDLFAQAAAVMAGETRRDVEGQLAAALRVGWIDATAQDELVRAHALFAYLAHAMRLLTERPLDLDEIGEGGTRFLLGAIGRTDVANIAALAAQLDVARTQARYAIDKAIGLAPEPEEPAS